MRRLAVGSAAPGSAGLADPIRPPLPLLLQFGANCPLIFSSAHLKSHDRCNALFGVHINRVSDKNKQTFTQGRNPFNHPGVVISNDGKKLIYYERDGTDWKLYQDLRSLL